MTFGEFCEHVKGHIKEYLPDRFEDAEVKLEKCVKYGYENTGLVIKRKKDVLVPIIYLDSFFERRFYAGDMEGIMMDIAELFQEHYSKAADGQKGIKRLKNLEKVKEKIYPKIINLERGKEYLVGKPYQRMGDMAVLYYIEAGKHEVIHMTDHMLKNYGITKKELHEIALQNLKEGKPGVVHTMENLLMKMAAENGLDIAEEASGVNCITGRNALYVLTNKERRYGAVEILNRKLMKKIAGEMGGSFYILPSSIHEVLLLPKRGQNTQDLADMVREVNQTEVSAEDFLSNNVYEYDCMEREVRMCR